MSEEDESEIRSRIKRLEHETAAKLKAWEENRVDDGGAAYREWIDAKNRLGWARGELSRLEQDQGRRAVQIFTLEPVQFGAIWDGRAKAFLAKDFPAIAPDEHVCIQGTIGGHVLQMRAVVYAIERDTQGLAHGFCLVHVSQIILVRP